MWAIRKYAPINLIVHYPTGDAGKRELTQRIADVHADFVFYAIRHLDCPAEQKRSLLDAVIQTAEEQKGCQTSV